MCLYRNVNKLN